eukprot:Nitzschia sp. Nitz4//scaffold297_size22919//3643//5058//NITZ4_008519-RA/size22919-processed-gene-0.17-mRNA-1//-1//CDS//3329546292//8309//frame0
MIPTLVSLVFLLLMVGGSIATLILLLWLWLYLKKGLATKSPPKSFVFFHPYCSGGGGGERVLWKIVQYLQQQNKKVVIFTIDEIEDSVEFDKQLRADAQRRFDVQITKPIQYISLAEYKSYLNPKPFLSLVLESLGTMKLAYRAIQLANEQKVPMDAFCDTTGCAFTFVVAKWMLPAEAKVFAYVHYPTISTDMMAFDWQQCHPSPVARLRKVVKLVYHWCFAILYGMTGSLADLVMVNSTWTYNHIRSLWRLSPNIHIVYPPCRVPSQVESKETCPASPQRKPIVVSIGQFRPEKAHALQIQAIAHLLKKYPQYNTSPSVKLLLIGSCRNEADRQRVAELKALVQSLQLEMVVEFNINPPYSELQDSMKAASIGIHTMRQEHFGIGIVEMMAAGLIVIAHNSGGPRSDIVHPPGTGFLATTAEEYAESIYQALTLPVPAENEMRTKAQVSAARFSDNVFDDSLTHIFPQL